MPTGLIWLTDYFAICALMPKRRVRDEWTETRDVATPAKTFDVPQSAMWPRPSELDLID